MDTMKTVAAYLVAAAAAAMCVGAEAQSLTLKGSDTMLPLGQGWAAAYMKAKPGKTVTVTGGGSSTGIAALINGACDVAQASRPIKGSEASKAKDRGFRPYEVPVARDGLAIVVNPSNPMKSISMDQLKAIYSGAVTNWKQLGGPDKVVVCVGRDTSSGTYGFFQDMVLGIGRPYRADMQTTPSTNAIAQIVTQDAGAVGYVGVAYSSKFGSKVKVLDVAMGKRPAVEPTEDNVRSGKYPLARYLYFYTRGKPSGASKEFIDWVLTPAGQEIVEQVGYYKAK